MEINDEAKKIVEQLAAAINRAVENSLEVSESINRLREAGYDMELTLRLEIGLRERDEETDDDAADDFPAELELTDDDRRTLRQMRIKLDDDIH